MRPELIVAEKEFRDHFASKRFIAIFAILVLLLFYGVYTGMDSYDKQLDQYKNPQLVSDQPVIKDIVDALQKQIQDAEARGDPPEKIQALKDRLKALTTPSMPSILMVFRSIIPYFTFLGMILGAMMGFDQISREKEEGSIKFLAISPLYRDAIINGKAIGAIVTLAVALAAAFLLAIAIVMFRGVVPGLDDLVSIMAFYIAALFYCTVFFAIAMMMSAITRNTSISVICTIGLIIVLIAFSFASVIVSYFIAQSMAGPAPPANLGSFMNTSTGSANLSSIMQNDEYMNYTMKVMLLDFQISDTMTTISPMNDFGGMMGLGIGGIGYSTLSRTPVQTSFDAAQTAEEGSLLDSLASVWVKILVLATYLVAAFAISYVAFMRMDIR